MRTSALWLTFALTALPLDAPAAAITPQDAIQRVLHIERDNSAFLVKVPSLRIVDETLRAECAAKATGKAATGGYCTCSAAVTMSLWRSGVDPKMIDRLSAFANAPDPAGARDFLKYQGPELYAPLCTAARLAD